ncbi:MAG: hypothetical protein V2A73_22545, partial [Pseudomonadota bacterium]
PGELLFLMPIHYEQARQLKLENPECLVYASGRVYAGSSPRSMSVGLAPEDLPFAPGLAELVLKLHLDEQCYARLGGMPGKRDLVRKDIQMAQQYDELLVRLLVWSRSHNSQPARTIASLLDWQREELGAVARLGATREIGAIFRPMDSFRVQEEDSGLPMPIPGMALYSLPELALPLPHLPHLLPLSPLSHQGDQAPPFLPSIAGRAESIGEVDKAGTVGAPRAPRTARPLQCAAAQLIAHFLEGQGQEPTPAAVRLAFVRLLVKPTADLFFALASRGITFEMHGQNTLLRFDSSSREVRHVVLRDLHALNLDPTDETAMALFPRMTGELERAWFYQDNQIKPRFRPESMYGECFNTYLSAFYYQLILALRNQGIFEDRKLLALQGAVQYQVMQSAAAHGFDLNRLRTEKHRPCALSFPPNGGVMDTSFFVPARSS